MYIESLFASRPAGVLCPKCKHNMTLRYAAKNPTKKNPHPGFHAKPYVCACTNCGHRMSLTKALDTANTIAPATALKDTRR